MNYFTKFVWKKLQQSIFHNAPNCTILKFSLRALLRTAWRDPHFLKINLNPPPN